MSEETSNTAPSEKKPRKKRAASQFIALAPRDVPDNAAQAWDQMASGASVKQVLAQLSASKANGTIVIACVHRRIELSTVTTTHTIIKPAKA